MPARVKYVYHLLKPKMGSSNLFYAIQIAVIGLLCGIQLFFYRNVSRYFTNRNKPKWYIRCLQVVLLTFTLPLPLLVIWHPQLAILPRLLVNVGIYPLCVWHFSFVFLFIVVVAGKLLKLPIVSIVWITTKFGRIERRIDSPQQRTTGLRFDPQRRAFVRQSLTVLAGATLASATYGAFRHDRYEITEISIPIANLPDEFRGFSIALISDIHSSIFMVKEQMKQYADVVNSLGADLIAVPGDFVNSMVEEVYPFAEAFSTLKAPHGVYGVLGNHDYYTRQVEIVAREVNNCGITLLRNERVVIKKGKSTMYLLGIDDVGTNARASQLFDQTLNGTDSEVAKVLLCHRPYYFDQAANRRIDLTLSGHTHGGQVVFAKIGRGVIAPARIASPYVAGLYSIGSSHMYVSRGVGTVGVPIRINCPPEVTRITLTRA
ncbi:MAG: metallophosphoesterase [Ignavibacteria bacterium]|nr:metallophosphoesterase [Ignavibacteria bacterium]MBI3766003.1 metallophosphoesterase [Ignavibacteriales bacterium]